MREIRDRIYRLGSKHHNFYVVTDRGKATIVDTGGSREWPSVLRAVRKLGLKDGDIDAVVITHGHSDHKGGAKAAHKQGVPIRAHHAEEGRLTGTGSTKQIGVGDLPLWKPTVIAFMASMVWAGANRMPKIPEVVTFQDGEHLDVPGKPRAIHTPGHTEGHTAYWFEAMRTLFTGDALVTRSLTGWGQGPQVLEAKFHADHAEAIKSLDRMRDLDTKWLLPGHGEPWKGSIDDAVDTALD